jgi:hypothetical protein
MISANKLANLATGATSGKREGIIERLLKALFFSSPRRPA